MKHSGTMTKFGNRRKWRDVIAAVGVAPEFPFPVTYPSIIRAWRTGRAWFIDGAARATRWRTASLGPLGA